MTIVFYASTDHRFDSVLAAAFAAGCRKIGVPCAILPTATWDGKLVADIAVVVGVKANSKPILDRYVRGGRHAAVMDKGYTRRRVDGQKYWRMSVDAFQPTLYLGETLRSSERWDHLGVPISDRPRLGDNVVFAGSSQKFCDWHGLGNVTEYARRTLAKISSLTGRRIVYRPSPSQTDRAPIEGYAYSGDSVGFPAELANAHCVVTYGSNACFEACLAGVPAAVLGDGVAQFPGLTRLDAVRDPRWPGHEPVAALAHALAHCQWTLAEFAEGDTAAELLRLVESGKTTKGRTR